MILNKVINLSVAQFLNLQNGQGTEESQKAVGRIIQDTYIPRAQLALCVACMCTQ